jgi:hypothetical protein
MNAIVSTATGIPVVGELLREVSSPKKSGTCPGIDPFNK